MIDDNLFATNANAYVEFHDVGYIICAILNSHSIIFSYNILYFFNLQYLHLIHNMLNRFLCFYMKMKTQFFDHHLEMNFSTTYFLEYLRLFQKEHQEKIINPRTNRRIKKFGQTAQRLRDEGDTSLLQVR